jgi:putative DNA primase/helicase
MNVVSENHLLGLDHAHDTAARGWPVVPYLTRADGAQLTDWPNIATTDPEKIDAWFGAGQPYEGCYVATIPGLVNRTVADIDAHPGKPNGFETAARLRLPTNAMVSFESASGTGKHMWYVGSTSSKAIYPGIDRKSLKALVRVPYLLPPVEDVFESLPVEYQVHAGSTTGNEFRGDISQWIELYSGKAQSSEVGGQLRDLPKPFVGHPEMLRFQSRLVFLAVDGHGGVPEALGEAEDLWLNASHTTSSPTPEIEWRRALEGAIVSFGGEKPRPTVESHPDEFFEKGRLKSKTLAEAISDDLAVGPDGSEWVYEGGVWVPRPGEVETRTVRVLGDRYTRAHSSTMEKAVLKGIDLPQIKLEADHDHINLSNGLLEWRTGVLKRHDPSYMSTIQLPILYDPAATCSNFDKWVEEVIPEDCRQMFWEFLGYMMLSGNPLQIAVLLYGDGGNGKGTTLRLVVKMLGKNNVSTVDLRSMSENKFATADLFGKIANIAGDIDAKYLSDTAQFKQITGEDTVRAEEKFKKAFSFTPWAVPVFSANKFWRSADDTEGYYRRWVIIPFPTKVDRRKNFDESLLELEISGIFNKAVANLNVLMERGHFEPVGSSLDVAREFRTQNDPVEMWLQDDSEVSLNDPTTRIERQHALHAYSSWCGRNNHKPKSAREFYTSLRRKGFEESSSNGSRYFIGLAKKIPTPTVGSFPPPY